MITKNLTLSAILSAISFIFLYTSTIIPTGSISVFAISIAVLCIITIECGIKSTVVSALVVSVLGFIFFPNKLVLIPYTLFFGYYPILKLYIERMNNLVIEWVIKICIFSLLMIIDYFIITLFFSELIVFNLPIYLIFIFAIAVFVIYDYALSLFINFYISKISGKLRKK